MTDRTTDQLGIVVIGRNEGERLRPTLESVLAHRERALYVDSASRDDSVAVARSMGFEVLELDPARPMSAARARNEGFEHLLAGHPELRFVQFVDGDSAVRPGWLDLGLRELAEHDEVAITCGLIVEAHPEASMYNRLCALEWRQPAGDVESCGGTMMVRVEPFRAVGGFRSDLVAGEEGDLCKRVRENGHVVRRLDAPMISHDSEMFTFRHWWLRAVRSGQAYAQAAMIHRGEPGRYQQKDVLSNLVWGAGIPAAAVALARPTKGVSLAGLLGYGVLARRIHAHALSRGWTPEEARLYTVFTLLSKPAGAVGTARYLKAAARGQAPTVVDHRDA